MKKLVLISMSVFCLNVFATTTVRYAEDYTCAQVQNVVQAAGSALIYSKSKFSNVDLYEFAHAISCPDYQVSTSAPFFAETRDNNACFVGYRCEPRNNGGSNN